MLLEGLDEKLDEEEDEGEALVLEALAVADSLALAEELLEDEPSDFLTVAPNIPLHELSVSAPARATDNSAEDFLAVEILNVLSIYRDYCRKLIND